MRGDKSTRAKVGQAGRVRFLLRLSPAPSEAAAVTPGPRSPFQKESVRAQHWRTHVHVLCPWPAEQVHFALRYCLSQSSSVSFSSFLLDFHEGLH